MNVSLVLSNNSMDEYLYVNFPEKFGNLKIINIYHSIDALIRSEIQEETDLVILKLSNPSQTKLNLLKDKLSKHGTSLMVIRPTEGERRNYVNDSSYMRFKLEVLGKSVEVCNIGGSMRQSLVVIGSSTGGPRALQEIIPKLPSKINASILIVQHMPPRFTKSLAERLNLESAIKVKEAEDGDIIERGCAYIAPGDFHMVVRQVQGILQIGLNRQKKHKGVRPAVDILMNSVAEISFYPKMGIILTGMGTDGSEGIVKMKNANSFNIIQDQDTCVVYGMPKACLRTDKVDEIVKLDMIADKIVTKVGCRNGFRCKPIY